MSDSCSLQLERYQEVYEIACIYYGLGDHQKRDHLHGSLRLISSQRLCPGGAHYVAVDSQKIDIDQIRRWLALCDTHHGIKCQSILNAQDIVDSKPLTLIDVNQSCLVTTMTPVTYATLSYVWGQIPDSLATTTLNVGQLEMPGSFEFPEINGRIPRTILDAITLTRMVGLKYLWVDRLCIIQDNVRHFNDQLQQMAAIYANAYFTIIAADGTDADYGLRGIGGSALPRSYSQTYFDFPSQVKLLLKPPVESILSMPYWYTRAWTFQERSVSRRTLVFGSNTVYWQCRSKTWKEHTKAIDDSEVWSWDGSIQSWPFHALSIHPWPDLEQYFYLVEGYSGRRLSFESDALRAFAAIIDVVDRSFPCGFLFGIPEFLFDIGLLWSAPYGAKRRKDFPSWSWLGWSGEMNYLLLKDVWQPRRTYPSFLTVTPIVEWQKMDGKDYRIAPIDNSYHLYQEMALRTEDELPPGWERWEGYFIHPSIDDMTFTYPFPTLPHPRSGASSNWSSLLHFRAERCTMYLGEALEPREPDYRPSETCLIIQLNDKKGQRIGVLETLFRSEDEYRLGDRCELIAISKTCVSKRDGEGKLFDLFITYREMDLFDELKETYVFHNVLWIEWQDGIAYRKAIGRVTTAAWESQDLEETNIVMG